MPLHLVCTGFGPFHGVASNPTSDLLSWLSSNYTTGRTAPVTSLSCDVLRVSAKALDSFYADKIHPLLKEEREGARGLALGPPS